MHDKDVATCPFAFNSFPDWYKTQEMSDKAVSKELFILKSFLQDIRLKKCADACLPELKFALNWLVTNKMLKKLDDVVFFNDDIVFLEADFDNVTFF